LKKALCLFMSLLLLLPGCVSGGSGDALSVYRVISPEYQTAGQLLCSEQVFAEENERPLDTLLRALASSGNDERAYNPLAGIAIKSCVVRDGLASLVLDEAYLELSGMDKTLCDACCVLTLCALPDIDRVSLTAGDRPAGESLAASDIYTDVTGDESGRRQVCLYYADPESDRFIPEYRELSVSTGERSERYVVEELLSPPAGLRSPLPEGTELLGVTRKGRACTINLSKEFLENRPATASGEILAVYGLVNSLATLGSISSVQISVEGERVDNYVNLSLSNSIAPLDFLPVLGSSAGVTQAQLYFASNGALFGAPCPLDAAAALEQALLNSLMHASDFGCYENLFSTDDALTHSSTRYGVCHITVSRSFFERRTPQRASLALDALALSLLSLEDVASVLVTYPDGSVPRLPGRDLSRPLLPQDTEIIK
jgi:hypothetical protein